MIDAFSHIGRRSDYREVLNHLVGDMSCRVIGTMLVIVRFELSRYRGGDAQRLKSGRAGRREKMRDERAEPVSLRLCIGAFG